MLSFMLAISRRQWGVAFLLYLSAFTVGSSHLSLHTASNTKQFKNIHINAQNIFQILKSFSFLVFESLDYRLITGFNIL